MKKFLVLSVLALGLPLRASADEEDLMLDVLRSAERMHLETELGVKRAKGDVQKARELLSEAKKRVVQVRAKVDLHEPDVNALDLKYKMTLGKLKRAEREEHDCRNALSKTTAEWRYCSRESDLAVECAYRSHQEASKMLVLLRREEQMLKEDYNERKSLLDKYAADHYSAQEDVKLGYQVLADAEEQMYRAEKRFVDATVERGTSHKLLTTKAIKQEQIPSKTIRKIEKTLAEILQRIGKIETGIFELKIASKDLADATCLLMNGLKVVQNSQNATQEKLNEVERTLQRILNNTRCCGPDATCYHRIYWCPTWSCYRYRTYYSYP